MEMVEEARNELQISLKLNEGTEEEEDRISRLPDGLLIEFLARLPSTENAIRTGTLSKRWERLWTYVPTLIFEHDMEKHSRSEFFSFVNKILTQCRQSQLKKFKLHTSWDTGVESQINNWIRFAIDRNVEDLSISLWNIGFDERRFPLPHFINSNSYVTDMTLSGCIFNPTSGVISWKNLKSLYISNGILDEDLIQNISSGSPLLETLSLEYCYGYRRLDINSESIKNLLFSGYSVDKLTFCGYSVPNDLSDDHIIEINAPNILSLTIQYDLLLRKLLLRNVSSLVNVDLDYSKGGYFESTPKEAEEEMLKEVILSLRHVSEINIGRFCFKVLSRLKAKGFISPSNLKVPDVTSPLHPDHDELSEWSDYDSNESEDFEELLL